MPLYSSAQNIRSYFVALNEIMQRYRALQRGRLAEQRFQLARMKAAEAGPKRKEILKEVYSAQSIENLELIDMSSALGGLRPPAVFSAPHQRLLQALDEMVAANQDKATARSSNDKQALSKAHQREEHAIDLWRAAANELKKLGQDLHT